MEHWITASRLDEIYDTLDQRLTAQRKMHVLGTCQAALVLATRWDVDPNQALAAMLLHDIAKQETKERLREIITSRSEWDEAEDIDFPAIWHAIAGAILARDEFNIPCEAVCEAIRLHPTGDGQMTLLEKIVFLADYTEPTRNFPGVQDLRRLAREDLDQALACAIEQKTMYVRQNNKKLHPRSAQAAKAFASLGNETKQGENTN